MIFSGFSLVKLLGGFAIWRGQSLGKLIYLLAIISFCIGIFWKVFIAPTNMDKSVQQAESITNVQQVREESPSWFKLQIWGLRIEI